MKKLEVGKNYVNVRDNDVIVIDRVGDIMNRGFYDDLYKNNLSCSNSKSWSEATEEEIIQAFERHLIHRYGGDWETMKIKERHPDSVLDVNGGVWEVEISTDDDGWNVYNKNGLLYCNDIWVERLEEVEEPKITIQDAIKANTVIHCETEEEAKRILEMAHGLGYRWNNGRSYKDDYKWDNNESRTCYNLIDGTYCKYEFSKNNNYNIIQSTQIADLILKPTEWAPEDIESMNKKASEKLPIDKVTISNLAIALRMVDIQLSNSIIDKVIDLVELIENKGDDVTIKDIVALQQTWARHSEAFKGD